MSHDWEDVLTAVRKEEGSNEGSDSLHRCTWPIVTCNQEQVPDGADLERVG